MNQMNRIVVFHPLELLKAKRMPIGTVSHGRRKVAEGRWVPVKKRGKRKKVISEGQEGTLPLDVNTLTESSAVSLIKRCARMPMKTLRKHQAVVEQQMERAFEKQNPRAIARLEVMKDIYIAAIDVKEFKDSTPEEWGKEIVGRIGRGSVMP